jgi:hypothetical protein
MYHNNENLILFKILYIKNIDTDMLHINSLLSVKYNKCLRSKYIKQF